MFTVDTYSTVTRNLINNFINVLENRVDLASPCGERESKQGYCISCGFFSSQSPSLYLFISLSLSLSLPLPPSLSPSLSPPPFSSHILCIDKKLSEIEIEHKVTKKQVKRLRRRLSGWCQSLQHNYTINHDVLLLKQKYFWIA